MRTLLALALLHSAFAAEFTIEPEAGGDPVKVELSGETRVVLDGEAYLIKPVEKTATRRKADEITIPMIDFLDVSVAEAVDFLRVRSIELDDGPSGPSGINFVVKDMEGVRIPELKLRSVKISDLLKYFSELGDLTVEYEPSAIVISKPEPEPESADE